MLLDYTVLVRALRGQWCYSAFTFCQELRATPTSVCIICVPLTQSACKHPGHDVQQVLQLGMFGGISGVEDLARGKPCSTQPYL